MRILVLFLAYYGFLLYSLVDPFVGLLFFINILIFRPENLSWGSPVLGSLHLLTAVAVLVGYLIHREKYVSHVHFHHGHQKVTVFVFLAFIAWLCIVSILAEISQDLSFRQTTELAKIFVMCVLFSLIIKSAAQVTLYAWVTAISIGALSFWGILQGLAGNERLENLWSSGSGPLAAMLALLAPFVFSYGLDRTRPYIIRMGIFACTAAIVLCLIFTESRGGFVGMVAGMVVLLARVRQRMRIVIVLVLLGLIALPWVPATYTDRISTIFQEQESIDSSAASRPVLWNIAMRMWGEYPIAGVGLQNFSDVKEKFSERYRDLATREDVADVVFGRNRVPHGLYPCLMAETGLVGTALFMFLLLYNVFARLPNGFGSSETERSISIQFRGAQAGLIAFAVASIFIDSYTIEMFYFQLMAVGALRGHAFSLMTEASQSTKSSDSTPNQSSPSVLVTN